LYLKGVEEICARQGGVFQRPLCVAPSENTVIFVAFTQDTPSSKRLCNSGLEDFDVVATESVSPDHRQEFTAQMYKLGYKTTATIQAEANIKADEQRKRDVAAEEAQKRRNIAAAVEQNRRNIAAEEENHIRNVAAQEARNRLITSGVEFRKSIKVGAKSNCGPIVEIRQSLAKVYHPVEGYGNEHWLEINSIFPEGAGCSFFNGRYQPPG
jgi:hypothetical protein